MADNNIKVAVLEGDFVQLVFLSPLLQQSALKLSEAIWTAKSTIRGFSVSFFWPCHSVSSNQQCVKSENSNKKGQKKRKAKAKAKSCYPAEAKCNTQDQGMKESPTNVPDEPTMALKMLKDDLKSGTEIAYEKRGGIHGVKYCNGDDDEGWTPVVGPGKK